MKRVADTIEFPPTVITRLYVFSKEGCPYSSAAESTAMKTYDAAQNPSGSCEYKVICQQPPIITKIRHYTEFHKTKMACETVHQKSHKHKSYPAIIAEVNPDQYQFVGGNDQLNEWVSKVSQTPLDRKRRKLNRLRGL